MKARLLFHCHHELGLGHLVRSLALARALTRHFDVVLLAGGELPAGLELPAEVEVVPLPEGRRAETVLGAFRRVRPDVIIVELFPFGRKKLAVEILPLLAEARAAGAFVACSVRDILVRGRSDQAAHDERAASIANRLFDTVLVHADPRLVRLEETFCPNTPLRVRVRYTGFVVPGVPLRTAGTRARRLVVSAGGGRFGGPLLRAAAAAAPAIRERTGLDVRLVAGPFLPADDRDALAAGAHAYELVRSVPDLAAELATAAVSLSQCGYNTALDVLRARVPALVVPFAAPGEDEQARRASLLAGLGAVRVLDGRGLEPTALAAAVGAAADAPVATPELDLDGARRTRDLLARIVELRQRSAA
jgi:predicted glycosyltransferase